MQAPADLESGKCPLAGSKTAIFLLCPHMVKETNEFPTLENWSPSKASFPKTIIQGTRFQHMNLGGGVSHSVVSETLCNPTDCSSPGSSVHGILQAGILESITMSSSGDLPNPGIEPVTLALQPDSLPSEPPGKPLGGVGDPNVQSIAGPNLPFQDPINERHYHPTSYSNQPTLTNFFLSSFYLPHPCQSASSWVALQYLLNIHLTLSTVTSLKQATSHPSYSSGPLTVSLLPILHLSNQFILHRWPEWTSKNKSDQLWYIIYLILNYILFADACELKDF